MELPLTPEQFFHVFARYNNALWWAAAGFWVAAAVAAGAAWKGSPGRNRRVTWFLAVLWLWTALAYHVAFFAPVNPAAWIFAAAFALEAVLLIFAATRRDFDFRTAGGWRGRTGAALVVYALAYPILNVVFGHAYPATPTFGVPCPTAILTLGLLLTVRASAARWLAIVPMLWGFLAGWAAVAFDVWPDYVLVIAAVLTAADMMGRGFVAKFPDWGRGVAWP